MDPHKDRIPEAIEYIQVKTSEMYRGAIKVVKWLLFLIGIGIGLFLLSLIFGVYFFIAFFLGGMIIIPILNKIIDIRGEFVLEGRIGSPGDSKNTADIINLYKVPHSLIELVEIEGGNLSRITTGGGHSLIICEKFDPIKLTMKRAWFDLISSIKFFYDKSAHIKVRDHLLDFIDQIMRTNRGKKVHMKMEFVKMFEDTEYKDEMKQIEEEIRSFGDNSK